MSKVVAAVLDAPECWKNPLTDSMVPLAKRGDDPSLAALLRTCLAQDSEAVVLEKYQSLEYTGILNMGLCVSEQRMKLACG